MQRERPRLPEMSEYTLLSGNNQYEHIPESYEAGNRLYNIEKLLENILERMNDFEKVKFRSPKPRKPRSNEHRCLHKNRAGVQCRGYKCKESEDYCFAHHTISTNDSRADYLYARRRLNN